MTRNRFKKNFFFFEIHKNHFKRSLFLLINVINCIALMLFILHNIPCKFCLLNLDLKRNDIKFIFIYLCWCVLIKISIINRAILIKFVIKQTNVIVIFLNRYI